MSGIGSPPGPRAARAMNLLLAAFRKNNTARPGNDLGRETGSYREATHLFLRALENEGLAECVPNPKHAGAFWWRATAKGLAKRLDEDTADRLAAVEMPEHLRRYDASALCSALHIPAHPPQHYFGDGAARTVTFK